MKIVKIFKKIIAAALLLIIPAVSHDYEVFAESAPNVIVQDDAKLLSSGERDDIMRLAKKVSEKNNINIYLLTENAANFLYVDDYAKSRYAQEMTEDTDGVLFYVNMTTRDYCFVQSGRMVDAINDYGLDYFEEKIPKKLTSKDYYKAFSVYLDLVDDFARAQAKGRAYDYGHPYLSTFQIVMIFAGCAALSLLIGFIYLSVLKSRMKTVLKNNSANAYLDEGGFNLTVNTDKFLYRNVSRTKIETNTGNHGNSSGGQSRSSSGGKSMSSRSGKF